MTIKKFSDGKCNVKINGETHTFKANFSDGDAIRVRTFPKNGIRYELHGSVEYLYEEGNYSKFILDGSYHKIN